MEGVSLVLPAFNEAGVIYQTVRESVRAMELLGRPYEIVVVDDGSTDETPREIDRAVRDLNNVKVVTIGENAGKGNALKRGFQASTLELVCFLDSDLDIHPYQVQNLISEIDRTGADIVIGSKRHPRSKLEYPRARRFYSSIYYYLILVLFRLPIRDSQTGIKLFRREVLASIFPRVVNMQYVLDLELLLIANYMGYRIVEAPVRISFQREYGRIASADIRGIITDTMSLFYRFYVLGYYGSPMKPVVDREPKMSIVIPTRKIDPMVEECVRKCHELNYSNFDIKLVTDSAEIRDLRPPGSRIVASGPVGPAIKRNLGVADSDAEIIAFIDADAYPDFDWLRNSVPYFDDEGVAAVGGPAVTPKGDSKRQQASGAVFSATMISGSTRYRYRPHAYREVDDYPTVNLLVRKADFDAVGGFNEEFWPGEDTVLCLKLTRDMGKRILYVPNVLVYHHRRPVYAQHLRQVYAYAIHRGFFVKKFPETSKRMQYFVPSLFVLAVAAGLLAGIFNPVALVAYLSVLGLYLGLSLASSFKTFDLAVNAYIFPGIVATHFTYGLGFIRGLLLRRLKDR